jgi:hypothetical protein
MDRVLSFRQLFCSAGLLIFAVSLGVFSLATAQTQYPPSTAKLFADAAKFDEPPTVGHYYYADPSTGTLSPLETGDALPWVSHNFFVIYFVGYTNAGVEFPGAHSSFRITPDQPQEFVIRFSKICQEHLPASEDEMQTYVWLFHVNSKKDKRTLELSRWPLYGAEPYPDKDRILCAVLPFGDHRSFLITPQQPLPPGEYAFLGNANYQGKVRHSAVFTFAVDPRS